MDIKKPQLVKVEAFADFFQSGIPGHIQGGSLEKMRVLQHPLLQFVGDVDYDMSRSFATPPSKALRYNMFTVRRLKRAKGTQLLFVGNTGSYIPESSATPPTTLCRKH